MPLLGKLERIEDLRSIWQHEAYDFSRWLAEEENISILSETIGIDITLQETESKVGTFNVDLYAFESETNRKIVIENQLEDTDHDHLGKIITYASGKGAEVIIWIVKRTRDEHKQAIEWLNQHTDEKIGFFLIEIELWKIDNSLPAPKFNLVESPNNWAKAMKSNDALAETKRLQLEFWESFCEYAFSKPEFSKNFSQRKSRPQHWYNLSVGSSQCHIGLTVNTTKKLLGVEIYIPDNKELFEKFNAKKVEIESNFKTKLVWRTASKASRILIQENGDIKDDRDHWPKFFEWYCEIALKMKIIIRDILSSI